MTFLNWAMWSKCRHWAVLRTCRSSWTEVFCRALVQRVSMLCPVTIAHSAYHDWSRVTARLTLPYSNCRCILWRRAVPPRVIQWHCNTASFYQFRSLLFKFLFYIGFCLFKIICCIIYRKGLSHGHSRRWVNVPLNAFWKMKVWQSVISNNVDDLDSSNLKSLEEK